MSCDTSEFETGGYPADELQRIEAIAGHYREIIKLIGESRKGGASQNPYACCQSHVVCNTGIPSAAT